MAQLVTKFFYNIETRKLSNAAGLSRSGAAVVVPAVYLKQENPIFHVDFIRSDGSLVTDVFLADDVWGFAGDDDFDPGSTNMLLSADDQFNLPADRPDLDVAGGKICYRVNGDSAELDAAFVALSNVEKLPKFFGEIQNFNLAAANPKSIFRFDMDALNLVNNAGAGPAPTPIGDFYTKVETDAKLAGKEDLRTRPVTGIDATVAATTTANTIPALRKRIVKFYDIETTAITGTAGMPDIEIKTDGGAIIVPPTTMLVAEAVVGGLMRLETVHNRMLAAGEIVQVRIATAGTSTTHVISVFDDGVEVDV